MQDPTSPAVFFTSRCWDQNVKGLVSIFLVPTSGLILKGNSGKASTRKELVSGNKNPTHNYA